MKYAARLSQSKGFTLIELLIVIALLGALAIGLLATIDPFEQLKKGRDTSLRNTVAELYNAELRYYSTKGEFTWGTSGTAGTVNSMTSDLTALINAGELKDRFEQLAGTANLAKIIITSNSPEHIAVCFRPESKSFQADPVTAYSSDGTPVVDNGCKSMTSTNGTDCHLCIQ